MNEARLIGFAAFVAAAAAWTGCAQVFAPQALSENYALEQGVQSTHPAFIDGDLKTDGETTFPPTVASNRGGRFTPPSEAYVQFPDARSISKIVIHSDEIRGLDVYVEDPVSGTKFNNKYDGLTGPIVELKLKGIVRATGVKLRIRRGANDAETRRENIVTGATGGQYIQGDTRAPVRIREIEIFGPASSTPKKDPAAAPKTATDEAGDALMDDLRK